MKIPQRIDSGVNASKHPQRLHIGLENGLGFLALVGILLAQSHDGAQRLDVEAVALAFGIDVADVVGDGLLLLLKPLDALDDGLELVLGETCRVFFPGGGSGGGHRKNSRNQPDKSVGLAGTSRRDTRISGTQGQGSIALIHSAPTGVASAPWFTLARDNL